MSKSSSERPQEHEPSTPPSTSAVVLMLSTIGSTTWRMFVPTIGLTIAGVWGDNTFATKPWLTGLGIVLGAGAAGLLVRQQMRQK